MLSQLPLQRWPPWDQGAAEPVVDHREPPRGEAQAFAISSGDVLGFSKRPIGKAGVSHDLGGCRVDFTPAQRVEKIAGEDDPVALPANKSLAGEMIDTGLQGLPYFASEAAFR